jgi:hypothetical protein
MVNPQPHSYLASLEHADQKDFLRIDWTPERAVIARNTNPPLGANVTTISHGIVCYSPENVARKGTVLSIASLLLFSDS